MKRWEYCAEQVFAGDLYDLLKKMGADGWELVQVDSIYVRHIGDGMRAIFKREALEEPKEAEK